SSFLVSSCKSASTSAHSSWRDANFDRNPGANVNKSDDQLDLLAGHLSDADTAWSIGSFGAIAEFMRDADEDVILERVRGAIAAVTARGGLRIVAHEKMRPVASESLTTQSWSHRVSLCLPEDNCRMDERTVLTEI